MQIFRAFISWLRQLYYRWSSFDKYKVVPCPSCGLIGPKPMAFAEELGNQDAKGSLLFRCPRCSAFWGLPTVVSHDRWKVQRIEEFMQDMAAKEDLAILEKENKVLGIKR